MEPKEKIVKFLDNNKLLTLATYDGQCPVAATVCYINEDDVVYVFTMKPTRKFQNIMKHAGVAFTVDQPYTDDWSKTQGVQMLGKAALVEDKEEVERIYKLFAKKYPPMAEVPPSDDGALLKITPDECYFIDNSVGFGHRDHVVY